MNSTSIPSAQLVAKYMILFIVVLSMADLSIGLPSSEHLVNNRHFSHVIKTRAINLPRRYCGRHIVNMLRMLCDGNYFGPSKRNNLNGINKPDPLNNAIIPFWDMTSKTVFNKPNEEQGSEDYFLEAKDALNLFGGEPSDRYSRKRRGIVDECCRKACTLTELTSYCEE